MDELLLNRRRNSTRSGGGSLVPYWYDGLSLGNISNVTNLQEISGGDSCRLATNRGKSLVVSDSPANQVNILDHSVPGTVTTVGALTLTGAPTSSPSDWEEVCVGEIDGGVKWCVGDFGDNPSTRTSFNIVFFDEITFTGNHTLASTTVVCQFPGGNLPTSKDMESMIFDVRDRKIYFITKRDAVQKVYSLAYQTPSAYVGTQTLVFEGNMTALPSITTVALTTTPCYAVGASISPNGKEIFVKNYDNVYYFPRLAGETVFQALSKSLVIVDGYVGGGSVSPKKSHPNAEPQGEAIWFSWDGRDYYTASEYVSGEGSTATTYPLFKYKRCTKVPTSIIFQQGVAPSGAYAGCENTYVWGTNPGNDRSEEITYVVDFTSGNPTDDRRGLLKFDMSAHIPVNAIVVGSRLDQWLAAEGQGWKVYPMLVTWVSASTQTSLGGAINNDGVKARIAQSYQNGINLDTITGIAVRDNIPYTDVQPQVTTPATNFGFLFKGLDESAGGDGIQFESRVAVTASHRPKFTVRYYIP